MPKRQKMKVTRGKDGLYRFFNTRTAETWRILNQSVGLRKVFPSGRISKVPTQIKRKK